MRASLILGCLALLLNPLDAQNPTFEEVISLQSVGSPRISPDGTDVVFSTYSTDWEDNRFDQEIWLAKDGGRPFRLTNTIDGSSFDARWSPDGKWIAFRSGRADKTQLFLIRPDGGEALQLTNSEKSVGNYRWSPDGKRVAFIRQNADKSKDKRSKLYGEFAIEDQEYSNNLIWIFDVDENNLFRSPLPADLNDSTYLEDQKAKLCFDADFSVSNLYWSPSGDRILFSHQPDPLRNSFFHSDISVYDFAHDSIVTVVENPSADFASAWSPDGNSILYSSAVDDSISNYYTNGRYFIMDLGSGTVQEIAGTFDENINSLTWTDAGILGTAWQKTDRSLVAIDPSSGLVRKVTAPLDRVFSYSIGQDGTRIAYSGRNDESLTEVFIADFPILDPRQLTATNEQLDGWDVGSSEMVVWKSKDGAEIEGVLHKPHDYDPNRKYPLMVVIHGGPTGISTPEPIPAYVYPQVQWMNKGALILRPNYRGSAGYGADFRALNVRNLGVGDAWDVESGVQHLIDDGIVHPDSVVSMGWSQGGYISAFLATNSKMFQAISVGAGISNWMTYYVNTDIHPFTRQYLKATPWSDKAIYELTSPMTNINQASTPTLIQHGEFDRRVPVPNAYELFQGLQDVGVPTELVIYKGFGHGITKPKERLAAIWHNWQWMARYLWGEEVTLPDE